jgi:L-lactate dehydrogenase complex protein LldF
MLRGAGAAGRLSRGGWFGSLPWMGSHWTNHRDLPAPAARSFRDRWKDRRGT